MQKFLVARGGGERNTWKFIAPLWRETIRASTRFDRPTFFIHTLKLNRSSSPSFPRLFISDFLFEKRNICVCVHSTIMLISQSLDRFSYIYISFLLSVNAWSAKTRINIIECLVLFRGNNTRAFTNGYEGVSDGLRWLVIRLTTRQGCYNTGNCD